MTLITLVLPHYNYYMDHSSLSYKSQVLSYLFQPGIKDGLFYFCIAKLYEPK